MALKQVEPTKVEVGGIKFFITPFGAFKAANLTGELANVLAPLLGVLAPLVKDANDTGKGIGDIDVGVAANAMANCGEISGDKLELLMRKLLLGNNIVVEYENEYGEIEPQRLDNDLANEVFCGDVMNMFVLCFHVIRLNFGGFFRKLSDQSGVVGSTAQTIRPIM